MTIRILISLILFVSTAFADTSLDIPINSTYLSNYKYTAQTQLDNDTVGFMAFLSVLKFESPYMGQYSDAASKAGDVAFSLYMTKMGKEHFRVLDGLNYGYNDLNPLCNHFLRRDEQKDSGTLIKKRNAILF